MSSRFRIAFRALMSKTRAKFTGSTVRVPRPREGDLRRFGRGSSDERQGEELDEVRRGRLTGSSVFKGPPPAARVGGLRPFLGGEKPRMAGCLQF